MQIQALDTQRKITSSSEQFVILGFVFDTDYVDEALLKLQSQCPKGTVDRIDTVFKTKLGFLSWTNQIFMTGYCIEPGKGK
jgi:hypothetical protein